MSTFEILIVDDEEDLLDFLGSMLSSPYHVLVAKNGQEAVALLYQRTIDLVISDVVMPIMDGFELCRQIKSSREISHIPVILLTAKNALQSKIEGLELGADAYIEKPFSPAHLKAQIANLLDNREKLRSYFTMTPLVPVRVIGHSGEDRNFLAQVSNHILREIDNAEFGIDQLAEAVNMTRITLYRKVKAISNMTPNEFIHTIKLKKSAELLSERNYKIFEVAMLVGYKSQTHFGKAFLKQFGMTPSQFISDHQGNTNHER